MQPAEVDPLKQARPRGELRRRVPSLSRESAHQRLILSHVVAKDAAVKSFSELKEGDLKEMGIADWPIGPRRRFLSAFDSLLRPSLPALFRPCDVNAWSQGLADVVSSDSDEDEADV